MKKSLLLLFLIVACLPAMADDYAYLTIEKSDGTAVSIASDGLTITFENGELKAVAGSESLTLTLADLTQMYFSTTTGISQLATDAANVQVQVYSVQGALVGTFANVREAQAQLQTGIYLLKQGEKTIKLAVK